MKKRFWVLAAGLAALGYATRNTTVVMDRLKREPVSNDYDNAPYLKGAAWPTMRGDLQNTGRSPFLSWDDSRATGAEPVHFKTGNGIFSTPVIDENERVYVGSADHNFYVFDPLKKKELWRYKTGEMIDSAAALGKDGTIYIPSGDAKIHAVDSKGHLLWEFDVLNNRPAGTFSNSPCFWWEGNVVIGPDGYIYVCNDDFFVYCLDLDGEIRWAYRTGFFIWSAPAFDDGHQVFVSSFDMKLYSFDRRDGRLLWVRNLRNPLVAMPAVGDDGTIYQGTMNGSVFALEPEKGKVLWEAQTGGHIYASAALSSDRKVYVTSADGSLYAMNADDGRVLWTYYTGEAVRSSPVLGPDPEGKEPYLIYFGGGNGQLYCIDPDGKRRWSYDTLVNAKGNVNYPNINASPAPGRLGIAAASANGDVIWVPYDYYLRKDAKGIVTEPGDGFGGEGAAFYYVTPGGQVNREPLPRRGGGNDTVSDPGPIPVHPAQTVSLRLLVRDNGKTVPASLLPDSVKIITKPGFAYRIEVLGDGLSLSVIPEEILQPGQEYSLRVEAGYKDETGREGVLEGWLALAVSEAEKDITVSRPAHGNTENPAFLINQMAIPLPPIVPSLDQIGIASVSIPFAIVESDSRTGRFAAWGVQRFGKTEEGELVGIPDSRTLFYAFGGEYANGAFRMDSFNGHFDVVGFPMPLDTLRFAGQLDKDGRVKQGAGLYLDLEAPRGVKGGLNMFNRIFSVSGEEKGGQRNWILDMYREAGPSQFITSTRVVLGTVYGMLKERVWTNWGFLNTEGKFAGTGTFQMQPLPAPDPALLEQIEIVSFSYEDSLRNNQVVAELKLPAEAAESNLIPGIMLINLDTGYPVPLNYNLALIRESSGENSKKVTLTIPAEIKLKSGKTRAVLMAGLHPVSDMKF